ncbi:NADPH-dependent FMN reductase [Streptomyces lavendulae]|uniref:NADPH-dependent FMN reductase n=1 Tax=Streptomyces lavendulae TaxID=1914 RepID=UPI0031F17D16
MSGRVWRVRSGGGAGLRRGPSGVRVRHRGRLAPLRGGRGPVGGLSAGGPDEGVPVVKIVLMSGSTRQDSVNGAVLETVRHVLAGLPGEHESVSLAVADLPFYEAELERSGASAAVRAAQELVAGADALFISTPSYNGEMPGALKNALDWLSRGIGGPSALTGKVTAVASASPGARGALDAQAGLVGVLTRCGARVVEHEPVAVAGAGGKATEDGRYADPELVALVESLTGALLAEVAAAGVLV